MDNQDKTIRILNSEISSSAKIFSNVLIRNSKLEDDTLIADNSVVDRSELAGHVEIGRRGYVQDCKVGYGSYFGQNTLAKFSEIGKYCSIAWNVSIGGSNHNYNASSMYTSYWWKKVFGVEFEDENASKKTKIRNGVWIGSGVNIIRGVTIGDGAVIGAGAVVTKDVEPYSIVVGVPAKVVRKRFDQEIIDVFLKIKWWDWPLDVIKENAALLHANVNDDIITQLNEIYEKMQN